MTTKTKNKNYKFVTLFYISNNNGTYNAYAVTRKDGKKLFDSCNEWEAKEKLNNLGMKIVESVY